MSGALDDVRPVPNLWFPARLLQRNLRASNSLQLFFVSKNPSKLL
jgi:hypothetical protein